MRRNRDDDERPEKPRGLVPVWVALVAAGAGLLIGSAVTGAVVFAVTRPASKNETAGGKPVVNAERPLADAAPPPQPQPQPAEAEAVVGSDVFRQFVKNQVAAEGKYRKKRIRFVAAYMSSGRTPDGTAYVALRVAQDDNRSPTFIAALAPGEEAAIAGLTTDGQLAVVEGELVGKQAFQLPPKDPPSNYNPLAGTGARVVGHLSGPADRGWGIRIRAASVAAFAAPKSGDDLYMLEDYHLTQFILGKPRAAVEALAGNPTAARPAEANEVRQRAAKDKVTVCEYALQNSAGQRRTLVVFYQDKDGHEEVVRCNAKAGEK